MLLFTHKIMEMTMERGIFMPVSTTEKILSEDYFDLIVPITGSDTDFEETFFRFGAQAAVPGYGITLTGSFFRIIF